MADEESILSGLFLCSTHPHEILEALRPVWNAKTSLPLPEKLSLINFSFLPAVFPWEKELSEGIEYQKFGESFFIQSDLFLRLRPGKEKIVIQKLEQQGIDFSLISGSCIALPNSSKIETVVELNKEAVVQDYSSQRVGELLQNLQPLLRQAQDSNLQLSVWDCCAGSGGKSILAKDILEKIDLTVSDVRESILVNLKKRFAAAGITKYTSVVIDLSKENIQYPIFNDQFSIIIADVPCTGSGTWSRTPEQLYFFKENKIREYAGLQKKIITNIIPQLKPGGYLLYITCSVFKKENEDQVEFIKEKFHLQPVKIELLRGYDKKADTMFAALLQQPQ